MNTINEKVINIIENISGVSGLSMDTELGKDLNLDSLDMVSVLIDIEECFGLILDESDINPYEFKTIRDIVKMVIPYCDSEDKPGEI
jgi:acyl carrier protein